jgi:hypothetical protein
MATFPRRIYRLDLVNFQGNAFRVLYIPAGVQNINIPAATNIPATTDKGDIIEFYDLEHAHTPDGQFTGGRYYLDTLMESADECRGLNLHGGEPKWQLASSDMKLVYDWLTSIEIASKTFR